MQNLYFQQVEVLQEYNKIVIVNSVKTKLPYFLLT